MPASVRCRPVAARVLTFVVIALLCRGHAERAQAGDDLEARRQQIASLQPADQQELLRKQERFNALPAEEQSRLRALQAALDADPDSEKLHEILKRYHEWLKTLTPGQRAALAELPPEKRVAEIKRLQQQQRLVRERLHRTELLTPPDVREILRWTEDLAAAHKKDLIAGMPKEQRQQFEKMDPRTQRRTLLYRAVERGRREGGIFSGVQPADLDQLAAKLSPEARQELAKDPSPAEQRKVVATWIHAIMRRGDASQGPRRLNRLVGEELVQFLQNEVPPPQRERLLKLPREEMLQELRGMYFERSDRAGMPWFDAPERGKGGFRSKGPRSQGAGKSPEHGEAPPKPAKAQPKSADKTEPSPNPPAEAQP